jgi:hypothetical protein
MSYAAVLACIAFATLLPEVSAHVVTLSHARAGVEIGREGNLLMRRDAEEARASESDAANTSQNNKASHQKPVRGEVAAEAKEAFDSPSKIDDSTLALWSPRMPAFIEKYPEFYGVLFACSGLAVLAFVWFHIYNEDLKAEEIRQRRAIANARKMVAKAAEYNQKRAAAFVPPPPNTSLTKEKSVVVQENPSRSRQITAVLKAVVGGKGRSNPPAPGANMRLPKFVTSQQEPTSGVDKCSSTKSLPGENMKLPKFIAGHKQEPAPASGDASVSQSSGPTCPKIRNGTVLMARNPVCIFDNSAMHQIGYLHTGQQVVAAAAPEGHDEYTMVPIKPKGTVDMKVMEIVHE